MKNRKLFTSESVGKGHPDKMCDTISDRILDACLKQDKDSRVACEVMASNRLIIIGGEITTKAYVDVIKETWEVLKPLGYTEDDYTIISNINKQSTDISSGVDGGEEIGAGDQGIMFGYATNETKELMPLPIMISHRIMEAIEESRVNGAILNGYAKSDMKAQVTIDYTDEKPSIDTVLVSCQHVELNEKEKDTFRDLVQIIIDDIIEDFGFDLEEQQYKFLFNPAGDFIIGGSIGDTGLTGRKIIVDTYGGMGRHGGGAFSGKDYTKVDRSGAYAARWVAKNVLKALKLKQVEIQLSYAIGVAKPISINVNTFGQRDDEEKLATIVNEVFDLTPEGIIKSLNLKEPIYSKTTNYGHFGKKELPWEKLNKVVEIKEKVFQ